MLSVAFAIVIVHPEKTLDATTENVESEKSRQNNLRVAMCQVIYLFQLFLSVIN